MGLGRSRAQSAVVAAHRRASDSIKFCNSLLTVLLRSVRKLVRSCTVTSCAASSEEPRNTSRMRRLPRLRSTARGAALRPAMIPTRVWPTLFTHARITKLRLETRKPLRSTASKSVLVRNTLKRARTFDVLKQPNVPAPSPAVHLVPHVRPSFSCVRESRVSACGVFWRVDMCASCGQPQAQTEKPRITTRQLMRCQSIRYAPNIGAPRFCLVDNPF